MYELSYLDTVQTAYEGLNTTEKAIADYLLKGGDPSSCRELGLACGCSAATVVRFCRKLGYEGFSALKYHIRTAVRVSEDDLSLRFGEQTASVKQKALLYATQSIQSTVRQTDDSQLSSAAAMLRSARHIQFCAVGSAAGVALSACSQLLSFGIRADFPTDELQQLRSAACLQPGDVLIGINYNNAAKAVADALSAAKQAGASTILITGERQGVLQQHADLVFYTPIRRPGHSLNISTTTLCQSMVLQLLLLQLWQLDPERFRRESARLAGYTQLKLYDASIEKLALSHAAQKP